MIIRIWGGISGEGGILCNKVLMNIVSPMIDRYIRPVRYGALKVNNRKWRHNMVRLILVLTIFVWLQQRHWQGL